MFDVGESLRGALDQARTSLRDAQQAVAKANAGGERGRQVDAAMARTARAVIFTEALLGFDRARFEALKTVTK